MACFIKHDKAWQNKCSCMVRNDHQGDANVGILTSEGEMIDGETGHFMSRQDTTYMAVCHRQVSWLGAHVSCAHLFHLQNYNRQYWHSLINC